MQNTPAIMCQSDLAKHPIVLELVALQQQQQVSDVSFAAAMRLGYSGSTWTRIRNGKYSGSIPKVLAALKTAISRAKSKPAAAVGGFVVFDHVNEIMAALDIAAETSGPVRLVIYSGHTGCGKTALCDHLAHTRQASIIEAAPSWNKSYLAALADIAKQIGLSEPFRSVRLAESAVINALSFAPRLLAIDEGNYFRQDGLNFLKLILNRTKCRILLTTLPNDFSRMMAENAHEAKQLVRRAVAIVHAPAVSPHDVIAMQEAGWPHLNLRDYAPRIAEQANKFGGYDFVRRVLDEADPLDSADIPHAILRSTALLNTRTR